MGFCKNQRRALTIWVNIFDADDYNEEALVKIVTSLDVYDLTKMLKQGEIIATDWLHSRIADCDFRIIVAGKRVGASRGGEIIDLQDGGRIDLVQRKILGPDGKPVH